MNSTCSYLGMSRIFFLAVARREIRLGGLHSLFAADA